MLQRNSTLNAHSLRQIAGALTASGVEIFAEGERELQIAERVRMHLMDSGVRVRLHGACAEIVFTATASRNEHPTMEPSDLLERLRDQVGTAAEARGYRELRPTEIEALDPLDSSRVLDVFHGLEYVLLVSDAAQLGEEVRWAVELEKALTAA